MGRSCNVDWFHFIVRNMAARSTQDFPTHESTSLTYAHKYNEMKPINVATTTQLFCQISIPGQKKFEHRKASNPYSNDHDHARRFKYLMGHAHRCSENTATVSIAYAALDTSGVVLPDHVLGPSASGNLATVMARPVTGFISQSIL